MIALRDGRKLPVDRNPLRMLRSAAPWRATGYLASYLVAGPVLFAVGALALVAGLVFMQLTLTVALTVGSAWVVRCCAQVERGRAVLVDAPVPYAYREAEKPGLVGQFKARCGDPVTFRDIACLVLLFPFLLLLDVLALVVWLGLLAGVSLPLWFWSINSRQSDGSSVRGVWLGGPDDGDAGLWIDSWPAALLTAVLCLAVLLYASYLVVGAARLHLTVAHTLLRPPPDPLERAKRILTEPGPLALVSNRPPPGLTLSEGHSS
ncbi:sensor domain-containing protein [Streptomyces sp. NBC_00083]|uniref:sensor domain-containing protein n=1 Tax=Streptomyces sp. NBC_00083 TaxID=2975647 RepID=UPI00225BF48C|nr:sensor domain-containing protein [Streptomyces sp. NBC_00083]MCX5385383.1 sensor domain-containing protein [Streptomyces sp. NBC_00083]